MGNDQSAEECPLCDEDLSLEEVAHRTGRVLAKTARRQNDRLEAAEAAGAAALALAERYAAGEAVAVAASEASRAEANRLRNPAHEATTQRLTEAIHRLVQESEERHATVLEDFEAKCAEADELRSENEKLKRELENARENERLAAAREAKRKRAQDAALVKAAETERLRAENLAAKAEAVRREQERALLKQHAAAQAAVRAAAACEETAHAEANRLQSENERLKLELDQERERAAAARAAAAERSSVEDEGVEESKSETQAPSTRVSFDAAEKISVVGSTPVEGETCGSRASSPKRKKSAWRCGGARAVTPPPSSRSSRVVRDDESDGGRRSRSYRRSYHLSEWDDFIPI